MNLMEKIYFQLHSEGLVGSAEEFSTQWCSRSRHWFAVQKRSANGFSVVTAIHCLRKVHTELAKSKVRRDKFGSFLNSEVEVLSDTKGDLEKYLYDEHEVVQVVFKSKPN